MRRRAKIDRNQPEIVRALRQAGASVQSLAEVGCGCPDILLGADGKTAIVEIKDGMLPPSKQALSDDEREWHAAWRGQIAVVHSVDEALRLLEKLRE